MKIVGEKGGIIAWHGTDRTDFSSFDVSSTASYNVGLHFGTRAAALDDEIVSRESAGRAASMRPPLRPKVTALINCGMRADDNPRMADDAYRAASCAKMNRDIIRLFRSLGCDGLVYANEIESPSDFHVIFSPRQVKILATESVVKTSSDREAA